MNERHILCIHRGSQREDLRSALERGGCQMVSAKDVREAIKLLKCQDLGGVLLDSDLHTPDGIALRNCIQRHCPELPMLLVSPETEVADLPLALFGAYVRDPGPPEELLEGLYA